MQKIIRLIAGTLMTGAFYFSGVSCFAQSPNMQFCMPINIAIEGINNDPTLALSNLRFESENLLSTASLRATNGSKYPIDFVFLLVEFRLNDKYLLTMAFYRATADHESSYTLPMGLSPFDNNEALTSIITPGDSVTLGGLSPRVALNCPDKARVTFAKVGFEGRQLSGFEAPDWRYDGFLRSVPPIEPGSVPTTLPPTLVTTVSVDSSGHGTTTDFSEWDLKGQRWWREFTNNCRFSSGLYRGQPATSEIPAVFRYCPKDCAKLENANENALLKRWPVATFIDLKLGSAGPRISYGGIKRGKKDLSPSQNH